MNKWLVLLGLGELIRVLCAHLTQRHEKNKIKQKRRERLLLTKVGARVFVNADHADIESRLVGINLIPLIVGQSALKGAVVVVGDAANQDDGAVVAIGGRRVENRKGRAALSNEGLLPWDAVGVEARAGAGNVDIVTAKNENSAADRLGRCARQDAETGKGCGERL